MTWIVVMRKHPELAELRAPLMAAVGPMATWITPDWMSALAGRIRLRPWR